MTSRDNRRWPIEVELSDGKASKRYKFDIEILFSEKEEPKPDFFIPIKPPLEESKPSPPPPKREEKPPPTEEPTTKDKPQNETKEEEC